MRQQLGLARGSHVGFELVGDHLEVRPCKPERATPSSGFGLLTSRRHPVPVDFDSASLLNLGLGSTRTCWPFTSWQRRAPMTAASRDGSAT